MHEANINAIAEAGITLGCDTDGVLYCPDDPITRAQMGSFLARAFGHDPVPGNRFDDVSGTHTQNINAIAEAGITLGCNPEGTLYCPDEASDQDSDGRLHLPRDRVVAPSRRYDTMRAAIRCPLAAPTSWP